MSIHSAVKTLVRVAALAGLGLLASCDTPGGGVDVATAPGSSDRLFTYALRQIDKLYIRQIPPQTLIAAGVGHLSAIDPAFSATKGPEAWSQATLIISYDGHTVGSHVMPESGDPAETARFLEMAIDTARQVSPKIAAAKEDAVDHAVFNGITSALDRFSRYSPPDLARELRAQRNGYGGIGITLDSSNDEFLITKLEPRGPADRAGIKPGDRIAGIDGIAAAKHSRAWVVQHLRGPVGTPIAVAVSRSGTGEAREFHFHREKVVRPTVTLARDGGIAVFRIGSFNQSTTQLIADALRRAGERPEDRISGVVLDLRGNPGGLLEQAVSLAELFVNDGPIIATVGRNPASHQFFAATGHGVAPRVPVVVLVNGGSASASEILAAALQDVGRAVVAGSASYGKGTVQTVIRLPNDGELTLTWARLISPSGYLLEAHGVVPTLCTADLADNPRALEIAMQRARGGSASPSRAGLDERGWAALRRTCPGNHESPQADIKIAERLLADPALYAAALQVLPAATQLVRKAAGTPNGLALTGSDRALNSGIR
ncbi:MAG TPA: S41 family peptidase [Stellaceae bacterium]|nr:S41 family peptidase [Stellaceae bacterium]